MTRHCRETGQPLRDRDLVSKARHLFLDALSLLGTDRVSNQTAGLSSKCESLMRKKTLPSYAVFAFIAERLRSSLNRLPMRS